MTRLPKAHEIYKHFKGNLYQIITLAIHSETRETLVIYKALYEPFDAYARPLEMFVSKVDKEKYPSVEQEFRFELVTNMKDAAMEVNLSEPSQNKMDEEKKQVLPSRQEEIQILAKEKALEAVDNKVENDEELTLDPALEQFFEADTYGKKLDILESIHNRVTDDIINTMAVAVDIEVEDGNIEERYNAVKRCLLTFQKYEGTRLR